VKNRAPFILSILAIILVVFLLQPAYAGLTNRYVVKNNPGAAAPYDTLANAAGDIQTAINNAYAGETVLVAAATYDTGGTNNWPAGGLLTNRVAIYKEITVKSINNDPANTIIRGATHNGTNGPAAVRCVYMAANSHLIGFTLTGGATASDGSILARYAGGIFCPSTEATVSNCVIANNISEADCGGIYYGTVFNSIISNNYAKGYSGGAKNGIFNNCTFNNNACVYQGGGAENITASNCIFAYNTAGGGGAARSGTYYNCLMYGNKALLYSGGAMECSSGHNLKIYNCTIVGNHAAGNGAGLGGGGIVFSNGRTGTVCNSIVYFNFGFKGSNIYTDGSGTAYITNSCTIPSMAGWVGSSTNDPLFALNGTGYGTNHLAGNYRLQKDSPCANSGLNQSWMPGAKDLDGSPRIDRFSGTVDMGCYEYHPRGTMFKVR